MSSPEDPKPDDSPEEESEDQSDGEHQRPPGFPEGILFALPMGGPPQQSSGVHPQVAMMMTQSAEKTRLLEQAVILIGIFRQTNHPGFGNSGATVGAMPMLSKQENTAYNAALMCVARVFNMGDVSPDAVQFASGPTQ